MAVLSGHQPVFFHTGLLAKVYETVKRNGTFFFHDLDTMKERGSVGVHVPKVRGGGSTYLRLISGEAGSIKRILLFTFGPVHLTGVTKLGQSLVTLADGRKKLRIGVNERVAQLLEKFPEDSVYESVAVLHIELLHFLLPKVGIKVPPFVLLSEFVISEEWLIAARQFLYSYAQFESAYNSVASKQLATLPFWGWDWNHDRRFQVKDLKDAEELLEDGLLIPKAPVLVWILRAILGYRTIRGVGGERYERDIEMTAESLGVELAPTLTVTSSQGFPESWKHIKTDDRPTALLLWLMGGTFDPKRIRKS